MELQGTLAWRVVDMHRDRGEQKRVRNPDLDLGRTQTPGLGLCLGCGGREQGRRRGRYLGRLLRRRFVEINAFVMMGALVLMRADWRIGRRDNL